MAPIFLAKSFTMCTCARTRPQLLWNVHLQIIGLKVSWNEHLQKVPGWRGSALVANAGLKPNFSLRRPHKSLEFGASAFALNCFRLSCSWPPSHQAEARTGDHRGRGTGPIRRGRLRTILRHRRFPQAVSRGGWGKLGGSASKTAPP